MVAIEPGNWGNVNFVGKSVKSWKSQGKILKAYKSGTSQESIFGLL